MKKILFISMLCCLYQLTYSQPKFIEKVNQAGEDIIIPYEKYELPNGLQVIIHEDHSDPICHVDVTYHVGSAREEIGRSGFAHFFEHMMFQGSDHVADEEHFKIVTEAGGTMNGTTNTDRTNYFETLPVNQLETALWLESDRMGFLLDAVTQKKFEVQRSTVKNERGQRYENVPYGLGYEKICRALYPYGHPYSWTTIGDVEDLNRVDVDDLKKFFMRWYGPNNATLTVAGDVNPEEVLKLAEKYFGSIPRGPEVKNMGTIYPKLDANRYISYEDNVKFPLIEIAFPGVSFLDKDETALDALSFVLSGSKSSPMYQQFIKSEKAIEAESYHYSMELAGMFVFSIKAMPDMLLQDTENMLFTTLSAFEKKGITDEELRNFKSKSEAELIQSLSMVSGKASRLAFYNTYMKNPNQIPEQLKILRSLTKEDVMRVYNTYIRQKNHVVLSVVPKGKSSLVAGPDNFTPKATNPGDADHKEYQGLVYNKPKDNFDRTKRPQAGKNPSMKVPALWRENLPNGLRIIGTVNSELPVTTLQLSVYCGHRFENTSKAGTAYLMAMLMDESTEIRSAEQINDELDKLGSSISIFPGTNEITINLFSLTKNLDATLDILKEKIFKPKFDQEDFNRLKNEQLKLIANQSTQAGTMANNAFNRLLFAENDIMSLPSIGTTGSVESITLEDVRNFYSTYWSSNLTNAVLVSNLDQTKLINKLGFLKSWASKNVKMPAESSVRNIDKTKIFLVNKEKSAQSEIRIGYVALPWDATGNFFKNTIMNYSLGGAFNSRINLNLREEKGYTYGARSSFSGSQYKGTFLAAAGVRSNVTDSSVVEFFKELKNFREKGITEQELHFTRSALAQSEALKYESNFQKAGFLRRILDYNLSEKFTEEQAGILKSISVPEINALAAQYLPTEKMVITIVGDKEKILPGLQKLGYEVVDVDSDGNSKSAR